MTQVQSPYRNIPLRLKPVKNGTRECWVVLMWDGGERAEIVIGARTKAECIKQANRLVPNNYFNPEKVYHAKFSKVRK
jgi:hypothetical protein